MITGSRGRQLKKDLKLRNGDTLPKGTSVEVNFLGERNRDGLQKIHLYSQFSGDSGRNYMREPILMAILRLSQVVSGFGKPPSIRQIQNWDAKGYCLTPTGQKVDLDGWGRDGSPSWMLVMGLI